LEPARFCLPQARSYIGPLCFRTRYSPRSRGCTIACSWLAHPSPLYLRSYSPPLHSTRPQPTKAIYLYLKKELIIKWPVLCRLEESISIL